MLTGMDKNENRIITDKVAIVILSYNNKEWCERTLNSVIKTDYPHDIIVIDNNSTDGVIEIIKSKFPDVKLIELKKNLGFIAYNEIIKELDYRYIVLLNNDIVVEKNWLTELMKYIDQKDVAAVNPKIKFFDKPDYINAAGGVCDIFGFGFNRGNGELDQGQYDKVEEVFYGIGAALLIKKDVWTEIGGFDERYFAYAEDLDWCWRARLAGYKIVYVPTSQIFHKWQLSNGHSTNTFYYIERNQISNFIKNYSNISLVKFLPLLCLIKIMRILFLLVIFRNFELSGCTIKGIWWNTYNIKSTLLYRKNIQNKRSVFDSDITVNMLRNSAELLLGTKKIRHPSISKLGTENA